MEELRKCPFCGGVNLSMEDGSRDERFIYSRVVHCYGCGTMGPDCGDYNPDIWIREQSAIAAWNRRVEGMNVLKASDITEAMEIFSEKCKKLDNMREPFVNTMLKPLLQRIIEQETALETALEDRRNPVEIAYSDHTDYGSTGAKNYVDYTATQNIGKKECSEQNEGQEA